MVGDVDPVLSRWAKPIILAALATTVAMLLQTLLRNMWQIRTLPERVMEWLLLFVPLDLFEQGLAQFGADAKEIALMTMFIGMIVALFAIGVFALHAGWSGWRMLGIGLGLWLLTMLVIMPVTGAGFFATDLLIQPFLTDAGYLLVFLGYATVLVVGELIPYPTAAADAEFVQERRALLAGIAGIVIAGGVTAFVGRQGGLGGSGLPLAAAPTTQPPTLPPAQPTTETGTTSSTPQGVAAPTPVATATAEAYPNPPLSRNLARNQDGSLTAAGRPKGQLSPTVTSNDDFYVVTKNAVQDPIVDAATWRLVIDGEVNNPVQVDYRTLVALPSVEITKTLECISNLTAACNLTGFGCDLLSTARFRGARLGDVLGLAGGLKSTAVGLAFLSTDEFSSGLPMEIVQDPETLIAYEMNHQPLPREHGFPARLLVPGRYGMKNPKWLAGIRAMNQEYAGWYEQRGWNKDGIVKTMSRIDTPADGASLPQGQQMVAGVAYAGDRGIKLVEISVDAGATWRPASFVEPMQDRDTMVRWQTMFMMPASGSVTLTVRATDGRGEVQTDAFVLPQPDGASGQDQVTVNSA